MLHIQENFLEKLEYLHFCWFAFMRGRKCNQIWCQNVGKCHVSCVLKHLLSVSVGDNSENMQ